MLIDGLKKGNCLIPYITLGDPDVKSSEQLLRACLDGGADVVELGIPFSDPLADGPVIQASHQRALAANPAVGISDGFAMVKRVKKDYDKPIVFMMDVNLILHYGIVQFFREAAVNKVDGVIIPNLSIEDAAAYISASKQYSVPIIFLVSPLCREPRLKKITAAASGFIYLIAATGTTGVRAQLASGLAEYARKIKTFTKVPVAVGFGVSTPEQVRDIYSFAEGAIVGSHLVKLIEQHRDNISLAAEKIRTEVHRLKGNGPRS